MCIVGTLNEVQKLKGMFLDSLLDAVSKDCEILDAEYGDDRNYCVSGGFAVIVECIEDFEHLRKIINFNIYMYEFFNVIADTSYVSAVYVINDDYAISVFMPLTLAPTSIIESINAERKDLL